MNKTGDIVKRGIIENIIMKFMNKQKLQKGENDNSQSSNSAEVKGDEKKDVINPVQGVGDGEDFNKKKNSLDIVQEDELVKSIKSH